MRTRSLKILAVDDDPDCEVLLRHALEQITSWDVELIVAHSGKEMLDLLEHRSVDLVLLDYELRGETGLDVLKRMRASGHGFPVIVLTGHGDEIIAARSIQAGATDYLPKSQLAAEPLLRSIFFALERSWVEQRVDMRRRELESTNVFLRQQTEDMTRFNHVISNELRNPLHSIDGLLATLSNGLSGPLTPMQMEYLGLIQSACHQMARCVEDLLDEEQRNSGSFRVELRPSSATEVVNEVVQLMESTAAERSIWLRSETDEVLPDANMDRDRVAQVLRNLIASALDATPKDGVIVASVSISPLGTGELQITVRGSGPGMEPAALERVQEALETEGKLSAAAEAALGIGLTVSREIVNAHAGTMQVHSTPGQGASVGFSLPIAGRAAAVG